MNSVFGFYVLLTSFQNFVLKSPCFSDLDLTSHNCVHDVKMLLHAYLMDADCDWDDVQRFMTDHFQGTINRVTEVPDINYRNVQTESF